MGDFGGTRDIDALIKSISETIPRNDLNSGSYLAALSLLTTMQMLDFLDRFLNNPAFSHVKGEAGRENQGASGLSPQSLQSLLGLLQQTTGNQGKINPSTLLGLLSLLDKDKASGGASKEAQSSSTPSGSERTRSLT